MGSPKSHHAASPLSAALPPPSFHGLRFLDLWGARARRRMAPALCVAFMVCGGLLRAARVQEQIQEDVLNILERFFADKITKAEVCTPHTYTHTHTRKHTHTHTHPTQMVASSTLIGHRAAVDS